VRWVSVPGYRAAVDTDTCNVPGARVDDVMSATAGVPSAPKASVPPAAGAGARARVGVGVGVGAGAGAAVAARTLRRLLLYSHDRDVVRSPTTPAAAADAAAASAKSTKA